MIESLSFTRASLDDLETGELKRAWTNCLRHTFGSDERWEWPCNVGMAEWYCAHDKPIHSISVYEHLLSEIHRRGLVQSESEFSSSCQEWLIQLFNLCREQGRLERAIHVADLIGDFHDEGFIGAAEYAEVIANLSGLRHREVGEILERERSKAEERYRNLFGSLLATLHDDTKRCLLQAELMSAAGIRRAFPLAAPLCWALAIESEFDKKVYSKHQSRLDDILGDHRPKAGRRCGIGQIVELIGKTRGDKLKRPIIEKALPAWRKLLSLRHVHESLSMIKDHRNQIAHITESGAYSTAQCNEFIEKIRDSGWIVECLASFQAPS